MPANLRPHMLRLTLACALAACLAACAGDKDKDELPPDEVVESLYNKAADTLDKGEYTEAAKQFAEVERQHPYSQWATKAQVMEAFSYYQNTDYDEAVTALNQFIDLHPGNADAAYAYYLRALCNYERIADVERDQGFAHDALKGMQEVISRFPDSSYAKDAVLKVGLIKDHMAGHEMSVGRWYLSQKLYISAIGRFREVVEKYQTTSHVPEALERLVESYLALGITKEAKATAAVLGYNFPGSEWYGHAYDLLVQNNLTPEAPDDESWIGHIWHQVF
ncbi:MAG: outer membrane protein assembly factor BamD [Alphaproteobacteria bacterium]|nr:outer membrane protein assembly factor BamD [Alphaproteobacteria bacterium]